MIGFLLTMASPGLSAPPVPKTAGPHSGAFENVGITREASEDEGAWNAVKNSRNPAEFDAFIRANPGSPYVGQAQRRAQQLRQKKKSARRKPPSGTEEPSEAADGRAAPAPAPSSAAPVTLDVASPYPEKDFRTRSLKDYTDAVTTEAAGAVTFIVFAGGGLLEHGQVPAGLSKNQVALGVFDLSRLAAEMPLFALSSLPFVAQSYEDALHLWGAARPALQRLLAERGMIALYAIPAVPAGLYAKKDIRTAADLKGLRITASDDWLKRLVSEVGAKPAEGSVGEAAKEAADGKIDGMVAPLDAAAANKAWSGFTTAYDVQASFPLAVVAVSQSAYSTLRPEVQRALLNSAVSAQNTAWAASIDQRNASVDVLGKENLTVQTPPQVLIAQLKTASNPLVKNWLAAAGNDGSLILSAFGSAAP